MKKMVLTCAIVLAFLIAVPWGYFGLGFLDFLSKDTYTLGLDLHGGVELDYLVDFSQGDSHVDQEQVVEDLKKIIDRRVRNLGSSEPTLLTAKYSDETHLIVQIPTPNYGAEITEEEKTILDTQYIQQAKDVIGRVVKIQFKEPRPFDEYERELEKRATLVDELATRIATSQNDFSIESQSIVDTYENVFLGKGYASLDALSSEFGYAFPEFFSDSEYRSGFFETEVSGQFGNILLVVNSIDGDDIDADEQVQYTSLFVADEPLNFRPARGDNGEILDERYLINTVASSQITGQYVVSLQFNNEGKKMFGDITERNIGSSIAIYLGNDLLTNPNVSEKIVGDAIITPGLEPDTKTWAQQLSNDINEGIVPVPIYQHSERTIGPNLGQESLERLIVAGVIGFIGIFAFLTWQYGFSGVVASACLFIYLIFLLAFVRFFGVVLTLSGVASIVLSLGMAIDANILILERIRDQLASGTPLPKALKHGLEESWSAIWDANITGLLVGLVLWWAGVSLIKGFGFMLVLGIVLSLILVKVVCMPFTVWGYSRTEK